MTNENMLETVELSSAEFRALCRRAAEGDAEAQYRVGLSLIGAGEPAEGREWIRKSFESGFLGAALEVAGFLREEGKAMAAAELLESVADEIPAAKLELAMCCLNGDGVKKDPERAERLLQEMARDGDGEAKLAMARRYKYGDCVPRSFGRAMNWLGQAMESGCEDAMERYQKDDSDELCLMAESAEDPEQREQWYRKAAERGSAKAQLWMGKNQAKQLWIVDTEEIRIFKGGEEAKAIAAIAVEWYRKAAEQGNAEAQTELGIFIYNGIGVEKDIAEAVEWFTKAAKQGHEKAVRILKEPRVETECIRKAAEQGDAAAQYSLAVRYDNGVGVIKDAAKAVEWYRKAAEQGCAAAQNNLGNCYYDGNGVGKDNAEAVKWYRRAAEQGNADAQNNLGVCYGTGSGVEKDNAEAFRWYRKAAIRQKASAKAQKNLADCYYNGAGVEKDLMWAWEWYSRAAGNGDTDAAQILKEPWAQAAKMRCGAERGQARMQYHLANLYRKGYGVEKDAVKAAEWYCKAAEQGLAVAQYNLGYCYFHGIGVEEDGTKAAEWLRKAADQGDKDACSLLGRCYETGFGVEKSRSEADQWYLKAGMLNSDIELLLQRAGQDGQAQYDLGLRYLDGEPEVGADWLEKAAGSGHKDAARKLAELAFAAKDYDRAKEWYCKSGMENAVFYVDAERGDAEAQYLYAKETKSLSETERGKYYRMAAAQGHAEAQAWVDQELQRLAAEMEAQKKAREEVVRRKREAAAAREKAEAEKARKEREEAQKKKRRKALDKPLTALFVLMMISLALLAMVALFMPRRFGYDCLVAMVVAQAVLIFCYLLSYSPPDWIVRTKVWSKFCGIIWLVAAAGMVIQLVFRSTGLAGATAIRFGITLVVSLVVAIFFLSPGKKSKSEAKKR